MASSIYRPLTGKRRNFFLFTQLFLGPDHLLLVRSSRFVERYQRFYFKDVQALVVTELPSRTALQASLGILAGIIFALALTLVPIPGWRTVLGLLGVIPAVIALTDYLRGERCRMILKTAVSNEPLPPVSRLSTARFVISRLKPAIEQTQLSIWNPEMAPASGPPVMAPRPLALPPATRLIPAMLALVSLDSLVFLAARFTHQNSLLVLMFYTLMTEIVLSIAALRRRGDDPRWILFSLAGVIPVCAILDILGSLGLLIMGLVWASEVKGGTTPPNVNNFLLQPSVQVFLWWGFGWRAAVAAIGWISFFFKPEAKEEHAP